MKKLFLLLTTISMAFSDPNDQIQFFKGLGDRSFFKKVDTIGFVKSEDVQKKDFEQDAIVFRGYGAATDWENLAVIRLNCFRLMDSDDINSDPLTGFQVSPVRSLSTRIRHELSRSYFVPFDQGEQPRSVVFRVVPPDYKGPIEEGLLIEGATYMFGRRHHNVHFTDFFTVPTNLYRNTVTTYQWTVNLPIPKDAPKSNDPLVIHLVGLANEDSRFLATYLPDVNSGALHYTVTENQEDPSITVPKLGGDLLIQNTQNPTREWMYIRNLQKTNMRLPQDADLVMSPETGRFVQISLKLPENQDGDYSMAISAHEESILPLVYSEQDEKQTREGYRRFSFYLTESEYQFHIYRKGLSTRIHTGAFQVGSDPENRITIELPPPSDKTP